MCIVFCYNEVISTGMLHITLSMHPSDLEGACLWYDMVPLSCWVALEASVWPMLPTQTHTLIPFSECVCTSLSWTPVHALILWTGCWGCSLVIHQIPFCYPQPIPLLWCQVLLDNTNANTHPPIKHDKHTLQLHATCVQTKTFNKCLNIQIVCSKLSLCTPFSWLAVKQRLLFQGFHLMKCQHLQPAWLRSVFCLFFCNELPFMSTFSKLSQEKHPHLIADFIKWFVFSSQNTKVLPDLALEGPHKNNV